MVTDMNPVLVILEDVTSVKKGGLNGFILLHDYNTMARMTCQRLSSDDRMAELRPLFHHLLVNGPGNTTNIRSRHARESMELVRSGMNLLWVVEEQLDVELGLSFGCPPVDDTVSGLDELARSETL